MKDKLDRYQYQPWYIKLWRRRFYLLIPYVALMNYMKTDFSFKTSWSLSIGLMQGKMNWLYDWEDIKFKGDKQ